MGATVVGMDTPLNKTFFKHWVDIMSPIHRLSRRDAEITASLLYRRYRLSKDISNEEILDHVLLSTEQRRELREEFGLTHQNFQVIMSKLKAKKIIIAGRINSKFIPNIDDKTKEYKLVFHLRIVDEPQD